ncbi:MAG: hypothetical protein WA960_20775 [Tunicatimonas sp.]
MTKIVVLATLLLFTTRYGLAQRIYPDSIPSVTTNFWKANFLLPGVEYERALGNFSTVNINPYVSVGYSSNFALGSGWIVQPSLDIQLRRYYNLLRRAARGKSVSGNSASFVALDFLGVGRSVVDAQDYRNYSFYGLGPVWGIQHTFRSNFNLSFQAGVMYTQNGYEDGWWDRGFLPRLNLTVGWALRRKQQ